ncbi:hypothetical protein BDP27DRAFT_126431 [Rhodocollybia butyracea]|uniref:Uncharacterized protein n=1 Tax=Rhodocollybia butyracea TaxID=206335 RepID=A0A9P5PKA3_9AGAR|nr:hypothetical protein BDP27DRAFT_126431 [Rhodocollybia butyracea]
MFILRSLVVVLTAKLTGLGNAVSTEGNLAPRLEARGSPFSTREIDDRSSDSSIVYNTPVTYFVAENGTITGQVAGKVGGDELIVLSTEAADAVSIAAIEGFGKITQAVCTSAGPFACAAVGLTAVIAIFFGVFVLNGRDIMESGSEIFPMMLEYPPITGCGVACRLHREAPEGDWRSIGNVTVNGTFHDIHFKKMNGLHGLRALQFFPPQ